MVDAKTGEDITRVVLTRSSWKMRRTHPPGCARTAAPVDHGERSGRPEFIMWYLKSAFDTYEKVQDAVQTRLQDVRSAALSPLNLVKSLLNLHRTPRLRMNWSSCGAAWPNWSSTRKQPGPVRNAGRHSMPCGDFGNVSGDRSLRSREKLALCRRYHPHLLCNPSGCIGGAVIAPAAPACVRFFSRLLSERS